MQDGRGIVRLGWELVGMTKIMSVNRQDIWGSLETEWRFHKVNGGFMEMYGMSGDQLRLN